jgi:cyclophilin family peptidyl-prolyl cis-trans isomerase
MAPLQAEPALPPPVLDQVDAYIAHQRETGAIDTTQPNWKRSLATFPAVQYRPESTLRAHIQTDRGDILLRLRPDAAPRHVANFVYLCRLGFYDGVPFQFITPGRRIQWGCPIGDGRGGPGYRFAGEDQTALLHDRSGRLSTANAGKNTDGCIFFITLRSMPWMDGKHTVFGEILAGQDVADAVGATGSKLGVPRERTLIQSVTIEEELILNSKHRQQ